MLSKTLVAAVAIALTAGAAHAGEKNTFTKEEGVGGLAGAAAGAAVGGPVGAVLGFMIGGIMGDNVGRADRAEERAAQIESELIDTRIALAKASERSGGDEMLDALAQRLHADVLFRTAAAELDAQTQTKLVGLGMVLAQHPQLQVQLHGFADPRGKSEENLVLSQQRAEAVRQALIDGGAAAEQIHLLAHGEDLTTAPQGDLEAYAWERRVTLSIRPIDEATVAKVE